MLESQVHPAEAPKPAPKKPSGAARPSSLRLWLFLPVALAAGAGAFAYFGRAGSSHASTHDSGGDGGAVAGSGGVHVEVAKPKAGGLERTSVQPGSVHAFDRADLYAKVSGYLHVQNVDIGDIVERGKVLAEIFDPEIHAAVNQAKAALDQAKAKVDVAAAMIRTAEANERAAEALVTKSEVDVKTRETNRILQKKQLTRIAGLVNRDAVEAKLEDEQQDRFDVAVSEENGAKAAVLKAKADVEAAKALVEQSKADFQEAKAKVEVAEADLQHAKDIAAYTIIKSPFDGVITLRSFHVGAFVRSASEGGAVPLLSVARTDLMRVVVPVPDRYVPFVSKGDEAIIRFDALAGQELHGKVARFSASEDPESRNMRTEIDLPNPDLKLRDGMWGRVEIVLEAPSPHCVSVPSGSLIDQDGSGGGIVYVVRDGKVKKVPVRVGKDDGTLTEILDGLTTADEVVVRYTGAIENGAAVTSVPAVSESQPSGH